MKVFAKVLIGALFAHHAASWLSKEVYNKWNQNDLERWLDDHDVPYPQPADRSLVENLVKENWNRYVVSPYQEWDSKKMSDYLRQKGTEIQDKQMENKEWLQKEMKKKWYETESKAEEGYGDAKTWIFDTWTDSQLKSFLDHHHVPAPEPRNRDHLLATARGNYATIAEKAEQASQYPGNWLYKEWSDSDLKSWLDSHGYPVPQPKNRDKLMASVRRNSRQASLKWEDAKNSVSDTMFNAWSDSQLKEFLDKNGVKVPQNGKRDEFLALARENKAKHTGDTFSASVSSFYGAVTSTAGNWIAQATDAVVDTGSKVADASLGTWSESRLKAYLDARGVPVPQNGKTDELLALARRYKYKAAHNQGYWTFENWTVNDLRAWLTARGYEASDAATETRDELYASAVSAYNAASSAATGGTDNAFSTVSSALAQATEYIRRGTFNTWSDSELKKYLDTFGYTPYQGSTRNELIAKARYYQHVLQNGWSQESAYAKFKRQLEGTFNQIKASLGIAKGEADVKYAQASLQAKKAKETLKQEL